MPKQRTHATPARTQARTPAQAHTLPAPHHDPVAALIAAAHASMGTAIDPSPDAIAALRKIFAHNDARPRSGACGRVSRIAAVRMLREAYGWAYGEPALEALSRRLGRKSWGQP